MIDSHAHMDFPEFDQDRDELFEKMHQNGISNVLIPGVSPEHWKKQLSIASKYDSPYALGVHPWYVTEDYATQIARLKRLVNQNKAHKKLVAIGECGLDKIKSVNWEFQLLGFEAQVQLAVEHQLPIIIHSVRAHPHVLAILQKYKPERGGIIHAFYGSIEVAKQFIALGFKLGIGGLLLNDNASKLQVTVKKLPINAMVVETDSPSMLPKNSDENRNTPLLINEIVTKIADLHAKPAVLVCEQLMGSYCQVVDI